MRIFVLTRGYPSQDRLYNHGFVHRRVLEYRAKGHAVSVFWLKTKGVTRFYDYDGVQVAVGGPAGCLELLRRFGADAVAAHAPADDFWPVLSHLSATLPVYGWIYGSEIMPFHAVAEREENDSAGWHKACAVFERRIGFWRGLVEAWPENLKLVFVSHYAAEAAMRAVGRPIPRWTVLPSPVDTQLFTYRQKPPESRFKVLSVRPFSDWRYANDLSVQAIMALRDHPQFGRFRFRFIGDGRLFDDVLAPVLDLPNVVCERRFLPQRELAEVYGRHGVFLCPSRDDAQGVSRDEAMSSGLVPVVSRVGAVPEFVDESCGLLTERDDANGLAAALLALAIEPSRFAALSGAAAARIRGTIPISTVVEREIELLST